VCFGNARLQSQHDESPSLSSSNRPELHIVDGVGKSDCHRSYATYLITTILSRSESDATLNTITSTSSEPRLSEECDDDDDEEDMDCDRPKLGYLDGALCTSVTGSGKTAISVNEDEGEDDDYQFSFDKDITRAAVVHPNGSSFQTTDLPIEEDHFWASHSKAVELHVPVKNSHNPPFSSNGSLQSYFVADLESKSDLPILSTSSPFAVLSVVKPVRTPTVYQVSVQSVLMGLERRLCALYSTGPLGEAPFRLLSPSNPPVELFDVTSVRRRSEACRFNATVVQGSSLDSSALVQFWNLLAVSLDVSTLSDTGGLISWNDSALGSSLFFRLLCFLRELNDLQTFAVTVCVVGGAARVVELLKAYHSGPSEGGGEGSLDPAQLKRDIDTVLYSYAQLLQQWGEKLLATEVCSHLSRPNRLTFLLPGRQVHELCARRSRGDTLCCDRDGQAEHQYQLLQLQQSGDSELG
jgi:hypothetical protein